MAPRPGRWWLDPDPGEPFSEGDGYKQIIIYNSKLHPQEKSWKMIPLESFF